MVSDLSTYGVDDPRRALVDLYDAALPDVYGYLASRCGSAAVAEDLTSETFLAAVDAVGRAAVPELSVKWLIGVARHKLVDHWRRREREQRALTAVESEPTTDDDPWDVRLDRMTAHQVLDSLGAHHRSALTFQYLDGLPVPEVAEVLGRSVGATEVLLVRARRAFRTAYESMQAEQAGTGEEQR